MKIYFPFLLLIFVSACITNSDFERLRNDVNDLRRESFEVRKDINSLNEKTAGTVKEDSFMAVRESQAEMVSRLTEVSSSLQELRGRFEENRYYMEKTFKDNTSEKDLARVQIAGLESQVKALRDKFAAFDTQIKTGELTKEQLGPSAKNEGTGNVKPDATKQEQATDKNEAADNNAKAYEAAYQSFKEKKYKESRERFESYIKDFPKNDLAGNSQFWIAEAYYVEKDYENAVLAYETLFKKYPDSTKTSSALLKQGLSFIEIGDRKTGKIILGKLIEKYPDSKDAELAKKKLSELNKKPGKKK